MKKKEILFKTLKPTGEHIITIVKGGLQYFMEGNPHPFETALYQIHIPAGGFALVKTDERVVSIDPLTKIGTLVYTVDLLRDKIKGGGCGFVEITEEDLRKEKMAGVDSQILADTLSSFLKNEDELAMLDKNALYEYITGLGNIGYDVKDILNKNKNKVSKTELTEFVLEITKKKVTEDDSIE